MGSDGATVLALLALGISAVIGVAAFTALARERRARQQQDATLQTIQRDLRALCNSAVTVGERIKRAERRLQQLTERQDELGLRQDQIDQEDPEGRAYAQAVKMAQKGARAEELMEMCGLTRGEADLIAMMHRLDQK